MRCVNHPREDTFVRCGKCGDPVCGRCSLMAPTGIRCKPCGQLRASPLYRLDSKQATVTVAAGAAVALLLGWLPLFPVLVIVNGALYGWALGEALLRASGRKQAQLVHTLAVVFGLAGPLGWLAARHGIERLPAVLVALVTGGFGGLIIVASIALGIVVALGRIRS